MTAALDVAVAEATGPGRARGRHRAPRSRRDQRRPAGRRWDLRGFRARLHKLHRSGPALSAYDRETTRVFSALLADHAADRIAETLASIVDVAGLGPVGLRVARAQVTDLADMVGAVHFRREAIRAGRWLGDPR